MMRVAVLRPSPKFSFSMDVYTKGLVGGLQSVRPDWNIEEFYPETIPLSAPQSFWKAGIRKYWNRYWNFPYRLRQLNADLFHIIDHSDGHLIYWLHNLGKPIVVTCHDLINLTQPETFQGRSRIPTVSMASWKISVKAMEHANHIITVSSHTAKDVVNHLNIEQEKISVIPNAVESVFHPLQSDIVQRFRQQHRLSKNALCLLNVGSNNLRKNVITILKVVSILRNKKLDICFWKTGADFSSEQKEFIETHNLESCVTYMGKPAQTELIKFYNAADILVAPSLSEGFGLTALEAMSCGTPVVTSNVTSIPEVVGDAGILINPLDIDGIVESILQIYCHADTRNDLSRRGLDRAKFFTWKRTAKKVSEVYEEMLT